MIDEQTYLAAKTVGDVWICYPWEATYVSNPFTLERLAKAETCRDIDEHDELAISHPIV